MRRRPRRLRYQDKLRDLTSETRVDVDDLIYPLFIKQGRDIYQEIETLPGNYHISPDDQLRRQAERIQKSGIRGVLLFGIPAEKDETGSSSRADEGPVQQACKILAEEYPELLVITDVCLCAYTDHGQCGIVREGRIDNDATLPYLADMALSHVENGADMVAPSDMMDGRVKAIRSKLDQNDHQRIPIMSYSAKYDSAFYGPFREAAESLEEGCDRSTHQMDPANAREALKEVRLDREEGADIVMVKPALAYLDIIKRVRDEVDLPVAAYNVSGEYSLACAGARNELVDKQEIMAEILTSIKRAGADLIITYHALEFAESGKNQ